MKQLHFALPALFVFSTGCGAFGGGALGGPAAAGGRLPPQYGPYHVIPEPLFKLPIADPTGLHELKMQTSIEVPPDRGTIPVTIVAHGGTYDSAAAQVRKAFDDLKKIGSAPGCSFKIGHYVPPMKVGEKWRAGGQASVSAEVTGQDPDKRIDTANVCFKGLREYISNLPKYEQKAESAFDVVPPVLPPFEMWTVESFDKHLDKLVTQANERLKAVQKADAKMWDHADVQCTSAGVVTVAEASSHVVTLQLEMVCPVSLAETASDPGTARKAPK
jgi:hypothetical protein